MMMCWLPQGLPGLVSQALPAQEGPRADLPAPVGRASTGPKVTLLFPQAQVRKGTGRRLGAHSSGRTGGAALSSVCQPPLPAGSGTVGGATPVAWPQSGSASVGEQTRELPGCGLGHETSSY